MRCRRCCTCSGASSGADRPAGRDRAGRSLDDAGHPAFRAKIREWLKVMRKANCLVLMATQSLSDAAQSGILDVIVESTATKIFLPNVYARDEERRTVSSHGVEARQIEILATAIPKRQYYTCPSRAGGCMTSPSGRWRWPLWAHRQGIHGDDQRAGSQARQQLGARMAGHAGTRSERARH